MKKIALLAAAVTLPATPHSPWQNNIRIRF